MKKLLLGIDIGGRKCAVCLGEYGGYGLRIAAKKRFETPVGNPWKAVEKLLSLSAEILEENTAPPESLSAIGVSCGGPLDSKRGVILSPPNLPGWDGIEISAAFESRFGAPCGLQNDANACALAEWKFGAGRGLESMVFLTFGTGLGAGLILDGKLYSGANDNAGEVGHVRLAGRGPVGYGKRGSFEGFCSGAGIAKIAREKALERLQSGGRPALCPDASMLGTLTAKGVAEAAEKGDGLAAEIYEESGEMLGAGLAMIIDILNPQAVIVGGVFSRVRELLWPAAERVLRREALPGALDACKILPAELGEAVGDYAALSVAQYESDGRRAR